MFFKELLHLAKEKMTQSSSKFYCGDAWLKSAAVVYLHILRLTEILGKYLFHFNQKSLGVSEEKKKLCIIPFPFLSIVS